MTESSSLAYSKLSSVAILLIIASRELDEEN